MKLIEAVPAEIERLMKQKPEEVEELLDHDFMEKVRGRFKKRVFEYSIPKSEFPQMIVEVPSSWPCLHIAPLYDVHKGHKLHDAALFARHKKWILETPNVLTFDGGDMIENASKLSVGSGVYEQHQQPQEQLHAAAYDLADLHHKMLLKVPGNHEDRSLLLGVDVGRWLATIIDAPYFEDYCFLTLKYAGNNFRILVHHGTGSAVTAGAQIMAARRDLAWAKPFDVFWTGHTHASKVDVLYQVDFDQKNQLAFERDGMIVVSPSYLKFFGGYGAKKRYAPGIRGLHAITLHKDGRIDATIHAKGKRL